MNILITNDDGWESDGLAALLAAAAPHGNVWMVAPARPMSGISHQLTFERPMELIQRGHQQYSLSGTPADCVRVALTQLDVHFDWVFSGINNGANLGADIYVSGTVAAAREASLFGVPAVALSQYLRGFRQPFEWHLAQQLTERLLPELLESVVHPGEWVNVNYPDTQGDPVDGLALIKTQLDPHPLPATYQQLDDQQLIYCGKYPQRKREPGCDADVCFGGEVSITIHGVRHDQGRTDSSLSSVSG